MDYTTDACPGTLLTGTGTSVITSGFCNVVAISFIGTGTGGVQLFAGVTTAVSLTPMITFSATSSAVAGGFSPMTLRFPLAVSGTGLTVKMLGTTDPNIMLFWSPAGAP